jgi:hypothetical protein
LPTLPDKPVKGPHPASSSCFFSHPPPPAASEASDDELLAKYLALAEAPAPKPEFAWASFTNGNGSSDALDPTSADVQRALLVMQHKLHAAQHNSVMLERKLEMVSTLQAALEFERAEVHRLDDVIAKFRSAVSCACAQQLPAHTHACVTCHAGVE